MYRPHLFLGLPVQAVLRHTDCLFLPHRLKVIAVGALALLMVACAHDPLPVSSLTQKDLAPKSTKISMPTPSLQAQRTSSAKWDLFKVSSQATLEKLFKQQQFSDDQLKELRQLKKFSRQLQQLRSSHELRVKHRPNGYVEAITLVLDNQQALYITFKNNKFQERIGLDVGQTEILSTGGSIYTTLFAEEKSLSKTELSEKMLTELIDIFRWDENFILNIQLDDSFTVLYERDLSKNQEGTILAAEFFTQGNVYRAVRYKDEQGNIRYYTPSGDNLHPLETHEKMAGFQVPVDYTKITSTFGVRKHPILRRWLFHNGVDYAAPSGTPIVAAAPATVSFVGRKRGYGKMVMLKHDERYETLYAHLSGFPQGLREGDRVNQGAVVGYVGQTGFATGPHLHFEIRIDGIHQDPLLAQTLSAERITEVATLDKASFFKQTKDILAQLDTVRQSLPIAETLPVLSKSAQTEYISTTDNVLVKTTQNAPTSEGDSWLFWPGYASSAHILTDSVER